jgi:hypothetical protein
MECGNFDRSVTVLDLGLNEHNKLWLDQRGIRVTPADKGLVPIATTNPGVLCVAQRPYLPDLIPNYDLYLWMDADLWVQRPEVIDLYVNSARQGAIAVTPELHITYPGNYIGMKRIRSDYAAYTKMFNTQVAERITGAPTLNGGMIALRADSNLWRQWRKTFYDAYIKTGSFYSEQYALNHTVYLCGSRASFLPAWCNWICHKSLPYFDPKCEKLCEPSPVYTQLGVIHLTLETKKGKHDLITIDGGMVKRSLRYRGDEY